MCIFQSSPKLYPIPKYVKKHILVPGLVALKLFAQDVGRPVFLAWDPQPPIIKNEGINIYNFPKNILL